MVKTRDKPGWYFAATTNTEYGWLKYHLNKTLASGYIRHNKKLPPSAREEIQQLLAAQPSRKQVPAMRDVAIQLGIAGIRQDTVTGQLRYLVYANMDYSTYPPTHSVGSQSSHATSSIGTHQGPSRHTKPTAVIANRSDTSPASTASSTTMSPSLMTRTRNAADSPHPSGTTSPLNIPSPVLPTCAPSVEPTHKSGNTDNAGLTDLSDPLVLPTQSETQLSNMDDTHRENNQETLPTPTPPTNDLAHLKQHLTDSILPHIQQVIRSDSEHQWAVSQSRLHTEVADQLRHLKEELSDYKHSIQTDLEASWHALQTVMATTVAQFQTHITDIHTEAIAQLGDSLNDHITRARDTTSRELTTWKIAIQHTLHEYKGNLDESTMEAETKAIAIVDCFTAQLDEQAMEVREQFEQDLNQLCRTASTTMEQTRASLQTHTIPAQDPVTPITPERRWTKVNYEAIQSGFSSTPLAPSRDSEAPETKPPARPTPKQAQGLVSPRHHADTASLPPMGANHRSHTMQDPLNVDQRAREARDFEKATFDAPLASTHRMAVEQFYNRFHQHAHLRNIPMLPLQDIKKGHPMHPPHLTADDVQFYGRLIYNKLSSIDVIPDIFPQFRGIIDQQTRSQDGYMVLYQIMRTVLPALQETDEVNSFSPPQYHLHTDTIFSYAAELQLFLNAQQECNRTFTDREIARMYLQALCQDTRLQPAVMRVNQAIQQLSNPYAREHPQQLPEPYLLQSLPMTVLSYVSDTSLRTEFAVTTTATHQAVARKAKMPYQPRTPRSTSTPAHASKREKVEIQCDACGTYGHKASNCDHLCRVMNILSYIDKHGKHTPRIADTVSKFNHAHSKSVRAAVVKAMTDAQTEEGLDVDSLIMDMLFLHDEEQSPPTERDTDNEHDQLRVDVDPAPHTTSIHKAQSSYHNTLQRQLYSCIQPIRITLGCFEQFVGTSLSPIPTLHKVSVQLNPQGDSGANRNLTDQQHLLWNFRTIAPHRINGINSDHPLIATGVGTLQILDDHGHTQTWDMLYSDQCDGTILAPDYYVSCHTPTIKRWTQMGCPQEGIGYIAFYNDQEIEVGKLTMTRENGLYFLANKLIAPETDAAVLASHRAIGTQTAEVHMTHLSPRPEVPNPHQSDLPGGSPPPQQATHTRGMQVLARELWHARLGHCGEETFRRTLKHTHGIPAISTAIPLFRCYACDLAKQTKAPRGPSDRKLATKSGERFHMDLGFIRGPSNLHDVIQHHAHPASRVILSRQGYVAYLVIIDAFDRYLWVFPVKDKRPPLQILTVFFHTHGLRDATQRIVRTDVGGELAASKDFRTFCLDRGYVVQPTAPDTSSQNGLVERPNRTLAEKVRCLLYSAGLGVEFWADALLHAAYLYNRTYHTAIRMTPIEKKTGKCPDLSHLRTFGSKVLVRKPGPRPTKLDPHSYEGIFLGYTGTDQNIRYYDTTTQQDKTAHHVTFDEAHYTCLDVHRPPQSKHLLTCATELPSHKIGGPTLPETTFQVYINTSTIAGQPPSSPMSQSIHHILSPMEKAVMQLELSMDVYGTSESITLSTQHPHPFLGFQFAPDPDSCQPILRHCAPGTPAAKIPRWRSRFRNHTLRAIGSDIVYTIDQAQQLVRQYKNQRSSPTLQFTFAKTVPTPMSQDGIPQIHFDQLNIVAHHLHTLRTGQDLWPDKTQLPPILHDTIIHALATDKATMRLTRKMIKQQTDWPMWQASEFSQLDKYRQQDMFGEPIPRPDGNPIILPWVWTYNYKNGQDRKARATCNGGQRYGKAVTLAETYASCVEKPAERVFWAVAASLSMIVLGADAGNAFAEAPPPKHPFYMRIDDQFREWWTQHLHRPPIPQGYILPVKHALQGHPEAPRLWEQHITTIMKDMGFLATTHERCLYFKTHEAHLVLFLRQVDDFAVACQAQPICEDIIRQIGMYLKVPLNDLGIVQKFNGIDITQAQDFIRLHCSSYIQKIVTQHGWTQERVANKPIPMRSDAAYAGMLEEADRPNTDEEKTALQQQMGFHYRQAIGEIIFAMVICRPDISFAVIKLSQYADNPAKIHFQALKHLFLYLYATKDHGLQYWRQTSRTDLPNITPHRPVSDTSHIQYPSRTNPTQLLGYTDSDWGSDRTHRRSVTGIVLMLAGAAVLYKTKYQPTVALSSTEAEFMAAAEAGKMALYLRSILEELGLPQEQPTVIFEDNSGARQMTNAQAPTRRTRHVDIRYFAVLQWVEEDYLTYDPIPTALNPSDSMTKATGRIKFHQHADLYMGRISPSYVTSDITPDGTDVASMGG